MDTKVSLQVTLCGECSSTNLAFKWPLPCMDAVVHLQRALTAKHAVADYTLIGIHHLLVNVFHKLLELRCLRCLHRVLETTKWELGPELIRDEWRRG